MHTLVTGGAGFIGSCLVDRLLSDGHRVDVIDDLSSGSMENLANASCNESFAFHQFDIRNRDLVDVISDLQPELIYHLAAQASVAKSITNPVLDAEINVLGSLHVLDAARASGARKVVFAASGGTLYGNVPFESLPVTEDHPQESSSPYGISKGAVVRYLSAYHEIYGVEFTALALANVYGPRQDPHGEAGVIAIFAMNLESDQIPVIYGDGEQTRDFIYVDDVVSAFICAATRGDNLLINIGSGIQTSINHLYKVMANARGHAVAPQHEPAREGEVRFSALSPRRARESLAWSPVITLPEGVLRVLASKAQITEPIA